MTRNARSIVELFPIIAFAKAGDLKRVKEWIAAGSPLNLPPGKKTRRQSPLQIAIDKGFLTLVEILLDAGADSNADGALSLAVLKGQTDIARLLLERREPVTNARFSDVCYTGDRELILLFLKHGADPIKGPPSTTRSPALPALRTLHPGRRRQTGPSSAARQNAPEPRHDVHAAQSAVGAAVVPAHGAKPPLCASVPVIRRRRRWAATGSPPATAPPPLATGNPAQSTAVHPPNPLRRNPPGSAVRQSAGNTKRIRAILAARGRQSFAG